LKEVHSVFSVFSAVFSTVFSTGLDVVVLDELRRLGRNGRKQARATTKAITGVGRSMKKDTTKEPSMGTKDGMKHLRQPRQPRQNAGILQPIPRPKLLLVPFTLSLSESLLLRHVALHEE